MWVCEDQQPTICGGVCCSVAVPLTVTTQSQTNVMLMDCPKSLHILWNDYMFGVGGSKPAKDYIPQESHVQRNKDNYNMRKQFWLKCAEMVNAGWEANAESFSFTLLSMALVVATAMKKKALKINLRVI